MEKVLWTARKNLRRGDVVITKSGETVMVSDYECLYFTGETIDGNEVWFTNNEIVEIIEN